MLDAIDKRIIRASQDGLPLTKRPYHALAEQLNLPPEDVMSRINAMQANGVIRRIGAVANHYRLGYRANAMAVWDVADEHIDALGERIGALGFVSHCYHRPRHPPDWPYNLFAMVHGRDPRSTEMQIEKIAELIGEHNRGSAVLYSKKILKKTGVRI